MRAPGARALKRLWRSDSARFEKLSKRAAQYYLETVFVVARVEGIYHQLVAQTDGGVEAFIRQGFEWYSSLSHDALESLIQRVLFAEYVGCLGGRATAWARYFRAALHINSGAKFSDTDAPRNDLAVALQHSDNDEDLHAVCIHAIGDYCLRSDGRLRRGQTELCRGPCPVPPMQYIHRPRHGCRRVLSEAWGTHVVC